MLGKALFTFFGAVVGVGYGARLRTELPPARDVLEDVMEGTKGFSGRALALAVMKTHLLQLAWSHRLAIQSDLVVAPAAPEQVLDAVADFLWQFRHLAAPEKQP